MDTAMRDLERIRERDPDQGAGRRVAVIVLAALATVALVFAVGVIVGTDDGDARKPEDPLMALDRASGLAPHAEDGGTPRGETDVDKKSLTFPSKLVGDAASGGSGGAGGPTDRPEMATALAAAEAELAHPDPIPEAERRAAGPTGAERESASPDRDEPPRRAGRGAVPADEARGNDVRGGKDDEPLARTVARNPLTAPERTGGQDSEELAPRGRAGEYTLQVISYRSPEEARAFAKGLRARGHRAFITSADIPERGRHWRVRIGPFDSKHEAEDYREEFEREERMNTYIVERKKDDGDT